MTTQQTGASVSRRAALAGLGAGGLGLALATTARQVSAQGATPTAMAGHPMVGTWIIDRNTAVPVEPPVILVVTSDGGVIDPVGGVAGAWRPTGARTGEWTLVGIEARAGGYRVVRSRWEVDAAGAAMSGPATVTIVAPNGTVVSSSHIMSRGIRLPIEPVEAGGKPLAGFPTWTPAPPAPATPTS